MNQKVAVIGTGRMGSALATALFNKGFAMIVWNRTAAKAEPLARLGVRVAESVLEAVNEADVVIVNIQASLEAWSVGPKMLISWGRDHGVDHGIAAAQLSLFDKAIKAGKGQADFAYLYEVLRKGSG